jgi:hypothetical protein
MRRMDAAPKLTREKARSPRRSWIRNRLYPSTIPTCLQSGRIVRRWIMETNPACISGNRLPKMKKSLAINFS